MAKIGAIIGLVFALLGSGIVSSGYAFDAEKSSQQAIESASQMKSIGSLMYACTDLIKQVPIDIPTIDKCAGIVESFNLKMTQLFAEKKSDMDEIIRKAIDSSSDTSGLTPQYTYGPQEYRN